MKSLKNLNSSTTSNTLKSSNSFLSKQSKYTLKANYIDYSQARNVVAGKLFSNVVHSRGYDDELNALNNGGAVDGFPIVIYLNNAFQGLYTLNIPKDNWMFGMKGSNSKQAIIMANTWNDTVALKEDINYEFTNGFDLEYCSTEDEDTSWVVNSFNEMRRILVNYNGNALMERIDKYIDVERAIDQMLFTIMIAAADNTSKNMIWVTYDGVKWIPSMYDMDGTFGLVWHGREYYDTATMSPPGIFGSNLLWQRLWENYKYDICDRFEELRYDVINRNKVEKEFKSFESLINPIVREAEKERWISVPSQNTNNYNQIITYYTNRLSYLYNFFNNY